MKAQLTLSEVRNTLEAQLEHLRELQRGHREAGPARKCHLQKEIDVVTADIRELDAIILGLLQQRRMGAKA